MQFSSCFCSARRHIHSGDNWDVANRITKQRPIMYLHRVKLAFSQWCYRLHVEHSVYGLSLVSYTEHCSRNHFVHVHSVPLLMRTPFIFIVLIEKRSSDSFNYLCCAMVNGDFYGNECRSISNHKKKRNRKHSFPSQDQGRQAFETFIVLKIIWSARVASLNAAAWFKFSVIFSGTWSPCLIVRRISWIIGN